MTLPNFIVIGAQKSGSSWFTSNLRQHPQIFMYPDEVGYFDNWNFDKGLSWYEDKFSAARGELFVGEGTPDYLNRPAVPERILSTLGPDVKLIACVRNPVDRAYSAFWNALTGGGLPPSTTFVEAFRQDSHEIRSMSCYADGLDRYLQLFGTNVKVFVFEESLGANAERTLATTTEFIGADSTLALPTAARPANKSTPMRRGGAEFARLGRSVARRSRALDNRVYEALRSTYLRAQTILPVEREYEALTTADREQLWPSFETDVSRLEGLLGRDLDVWRHRNATRPQ